MKKFLQIPLLLVALFLSSIPISAYDFKVDGFYFNILSETEKTVEVTHDDSDNCYRGSVKIPSSVTFNGITYSVTSIGDYTFDYCTNLSSITIPNSITKIGNYAFLDCYSLYPTVTIPNSVISIGEGAFKNCLELRDITIPNSVTSIGDHAFYFCNKLSKVYYNAENCVSMGSADYPVFQSSALAFIYIGESVKTIPNYAFYGCKDIGRYGISIPNSVTSIGSYAFYECTGLISVSIGNSVAEIGSSAFGGCTSLSMVTITDLSAWCKIDFGSYNANPLCYAMSFILNGKKIKDIVIPNDVTEIKNYAFYHYDNLTSVKIPNSVTEIGDYAFSDCDGLTSISIPNSVSSISSSAFSWCSGLTSFVVESDNLKYDSRNNCNAIIETTSNMLVAGCENTQIPNSIIQIGNGAFAGRRGLTSLEIPNSVISIGDYAFNGCGLRLIMSHSAVPPTCGSDVFGGEIDSYSALLMIPEGSLIDYALADEWHKFTQVHEVSEATVSTREKNATFVIPTIEGATEYVVTVYSDITMSQLVATTHYDSYGEIAPMSTTLELSIDGFVDGVYYYKVLVKSETGDILNNYIGTFEIDVAGVENIEADNVVLEVARYDIHGRLLSKPTLGINIVKYSDGTTRKECVKK